MTDPGRDGTIDINKRSPGEPENMTGEKRTQTKQQKSNEDSRRAREINNSVRKVLAL